MKKVMFILLAVSINLMGLCLNTAAQVNMNIKAGINIAKTKDLSPAEGNRTAYYAGAQAAIRLIGKLIFQPEIILSAKGYKYKPSLGEKYTAIRMKYVNMPLLLGYNITKDTRILAGAELGYLLDASKNSPYKKEDITAAFPEKFDIGLAVGFSQNLGKRIGVEARYIYGLPGFHQVNNTGDRVNENDAAHRVFQAGLFYRIL